MSFQPPSSFHTHLLSGPHITGQMQRCWALLQSPLSEQEQAHPVLYPNSTGFFIFKDYLSIIGVQCCVRFLCTPMCISDMYAYMFPLLSLPPHHPIPLGHHRALSWAPRVIQQLPTSYLFYTFLLFHRSVMSDSVTPWTAAYQATLSFTISQSLLKLMSIESVLSSNHLILGHPLLPSVFPSIRVFSDESALYTWQCVSVSAVLPLHPNLLIPSTAVTRLFSMSVSQLFLPLAYSCIDLNSTLILPVFPYNSTLVKTWLHPFLVLSSIFFLSHIHIPVLYITHLISFIPYFQFPHIWASLRFLIVKQ